jgi:hypothetical protein
MEDVLHGAQNLRQRFRVELRRSTRAGRQTRQADLATTRLDLVHMLLMITVASARCGNWSPSFTGSETDY